MKDRYILLIAVLFIFTAIPSSYAGFVVKNSPARTILNTAETKPALSGSAIHNLAPKTSSGRPAYLLSPYNPYKKNEWYGIAAIISGLLGLFIPGVNFLAILFGILGMSRGCEAQGLAIAGFVIGVIELGIFLLTSSVFLSLILF